MENTDTDLAGELFARYASILLPAEQPLHAVDANGAKFISLLVRETMEGSMMLIDSASQRIESHKIELEGGDRA
jgi:hypothetical protein